MNQKMRHISLHVFYLIFILSLSGCSGLKPMALNSKTKTLNLEKKSIALFVLEMKNEYKPGYKPIPTSIEIFPQNGKKLIYKADDLCSIDLVPGTYTIGKVSGYASGLFITGGFSFDIGTSFTLNPNTVSYIGNIKMVNRKKQKGEKSSGGPFPLIDQAATGFSDGTFDVFIEEKGDTDMQLFENKYPILKQQLVMNNLMTKFN